ncbi:MAG: hypothetical protein AAF517_16485 [Planctomycetota bacterium]
MGGGSRASTPRYGNLGFWSHRDDRAIWTVNVPGRGDEARRYDAWIDFAVPDSLAGQEYELRIGTSTLRAKTPRTGTWDD